VAAQPGAIHAVAHGRDVSRPVGPEDDRQRDAGVQTLANPGVAVVERRGPQRDDCFAGTRLRVGNLVEGEAFGPAEFAEKDGFHDG
jgi:hypothetical protein